MDNADKLLWKLMIDRGSLGEWCFYGCRYMYEDNKIRKKFNKDLKTSSIDWKKTQPIRSEREPSFTGTFHEPEYLEVLEGILVFENGNKYNFGMREDAVDLMREMANYLPEIKI